MVNRIKCGFVIVLLLFSVVAQSQNAFNGSRQSVGSKKGTAFNKSRVNDFNAHRQSLNAEYVKKTREKWNTFNSLRGIISPDKDSKPVFPVVMSEEDAIRDKRDKEVVVEGIIKPLHDRGVPKPFAPIQENIREHTDDFKFSYLGTSLSVRVPIKQSLHLSSTSEDAVADAWEYLCGDYYNNMIVDCLKLRSGLNLCDWAYLMMLKTLGETIYPNRSNEAVLLTAYIFSQSGYKIRLGERNGRLEMLYASKHKVYEKPYFEFGDDRFYSMSDEIGEMRINAAQYPQERSLSLWVEKEPQITYSATQDRTLVSKRYPSMSVIVSANKNILPFYNSYPSSEVGGNFMTRWAMYANMPISKELRKNLYPQLKQGIAGCTQLQSVERLLNWVQTAFVYEYDDTVWGTDRSFFPEETLYYPYCDCEDRSILFTRLVRDLLGLKCLLIYYPGHLATAVCFEESVNGDYLNVNGNRYVVCDPTYIGASVGHTMPDMDNETAKVIVL